MAAPSKKSLSFEAALAELEGIVGAMETGKIPLDEALARYQRGVELLRDCNATLRAAEQKVAILEADSLRDMSPSELNPVRNVDSDA
ncbi:MAG: exodeoxyribonuclease VII small subunit [Rhodocyclaceae bacterium]|nr:exodeoxyribonuclease VII small subunit [Rhodocyclaceae bacterium]